MNHKELFQRLGETIGTYYNQSVWGDCNDINATLAYILKEELNMDVRCVSGYVQCDNPTTDEMVYDPKHFWIVLHGKVLDFACRQFNKSFSNQILNDAMNQCYFYGECEVFISSTEWNVDNEWVNHDLVATFLDDSHEDFLGVDEFQEGKNNED